MALAAAPLRVVTGKPLTLSGVAGSVRAGRIVPLKGARLEVQYWTRGATAWTTLRVLVAPTGTYRVVWRYPLRASSTVRVLLAAGSTTRAAVSPSRAVTRVVPLPAPRKYMNCAALNKVYPHGVGLPGAVDRTSGSPVVDFTRDAATYRLNPARDRDKDRIACERR